MRAHQAPWTQRPFRDADLPALVDLYQAAYRQHPEYGEADEAGARRYLRWLLRHHTFFPVAEHAGQPVGFLVADAAWRDRQGRPVGEIHELAVHPDFWGTGLARALLQAALEHFRQRGLRRAGLWVGRHNARAQAFYRGFGFQPISEGFWVRMEKRW